MNGFNSDLLDGKTKLHFIGIGGSGMFPLVQILHAVGYEITGSDAGEGDIVDRERAMGIDVFHGHRAENVHGTQLVVYSAAIPSDNPELAEAARLGIPAVERSVMLGYVANTYQHPICISGTHGKTTTTAMTVQTMLMAGGDPAAVIGGKLPYIDAYGRYGAAREIVVEACEYHNTFLQLVPYVSVILNVDADHLEFFKTMDNLKASFRRFALLTEQAVIANLDDANTREVLEGVDRDVVTFGVDTPADYRAVHITEYRPAFFAFDVLVHGAPAAHVELSVPGRHNVYNALAAFAAASMFGCTSSSAPRASTRSAARAAGSRFWAKRAASPSRTTTPTTRPSWPPRWPAPRRCATAPCGPCSSRSPTRARRCFWTISRACCARPTMWCSPRSWAAAKRRRITRCARPTSPRRSPAACGLTPLKRWPAM